MKQLYLRQRGMMMASTVRRLLERVRMHDGRTMLHMDVRKKRDTAIIRNKKYLVLEKLYRFITLSYLSLTLSGIECFSPAMPLHFGSKIGTSSLSTFFFR